MKRVLLIILAVVGIFLIVAISMAGLGAQRSKTSSGAYFGGGGGAPFQPTLAPAAEAPPSDFFGYDQREEAFNRAAQAQERLIIQSADLAVVVRDPGERMQEIASLAREFGGFVVSSNIYQSTSLGREVPEANIVIRVPSERLDEALDRIKEGAVEVDYENRSGQDVTNQYVDLQAQLRAKEAAEQKLLEIMDQATRAEDVLAIYLQLQGVQTEIEQLKGQIKYLEESAALSAISVRLIAEEGIQPLQVGPWRPEGAAREAIQDLIFFFQSFVEFLIRFALYALPALLLIAVPLYLIFLAGRAVYRRVRRSSETVEQSEELRK